jgi:hypothetical protein
MNIDEEIKKLLEGGVIRVSSFTENLPIAVFEPTDKALPTCRAHSDRGYRHLLLVLLSKARGCDEYKKIADEHYTYALGITGHKGFDRFLEKRTLGIWLVQDRIVIHADQTFMPSPHHTPGPYRTSGEGLTLTEAIENVLLSTPVLEVCVYNPFHSS